VKTFYLAGASANREHLAVLAGELQKLGLEWAGDWNWMHQFNSAERTPNTWGQRTMLDLMAATTADLCVVICCPALSFGAGVEVGWRTAHGRKIDFVFHRRPMDHPFFTLPQARLWNSWEEFYETLQEHLAQRSSSARAGTLAAFL
jgi:hypothetical protein